MIMEETTTIPTAEESPGESLERGDDVFKGNGSVSGSDTEDDFTVTQRYYYRGSGSSGSETDDSTSIPRVELHPPPADSTVTTTTTDVPSPKIITTRPITRAYAVLIAASRRKEPPLEESPSE